MRKDGWKWKFKATADSKHTLPVAKNLLNQKFGATAPNQVLVSDITFISTEEGWLCRKGNCYDNAPMESFWGTLKNELVHHRYYANKDQAIQGITEYIEVFYNRQRRQARLGYLSPYAYERQFYAKQMAA